MKPILLAALLLIPMVAEAQTQAEFGRASGGEITLFAKAPSQLSGSLGLSLGHGRGYGGTFGGTLVKDKVWFFGSADRTQQTFTNFNFQATPTARTSATVTTLPSSFLSLKSTVVLSDNAFVTATVTTRK